MIFMEEPQVFNLTVGIMPLARPQSYPTPPFPAWLPAVTVAVSMLVFLAGSFYLRHRKVMKKRQILMDYFYIIFQYGGSRRKRMVTALCNTNAITLRELGRSFMISCESVPGSDDNSCPFYLDDSYSKPPGHLRRPLTKKSSLLKRGFTITRRHRGPFLKMKTQSEENGRQYPYSFQDIVMKLGGRRHHADSSRSRSANRHALLTPQFEGCSMSTIHGDEMEYATPKEDCGSSEFSNRQRRNAYILQYDKSIPRFADVAAELSRNSLGHGTPERLKAQHSPYPGKRNSEPWHSLYDSESQTQGLQPDVFHVQGSMLSPSSVVRGSHGYISSIDKDRNTYQPYRNSEPTILVHSPSMDADASQGWNDIRSRYTNGVVFLKRVSKEDDGSPGQYYYEEERQPSADRPVRASLSKVSYVPSGNMNQYQNCILSPNKDKPSKEEETQSKKTKGENISQGMSKSKRGRLNLGRLGVGNFSRRIDLASDSLQDYEPEHSAENKSSSESANHQRTSPRTTWKRFKNVFSGSRDTQNVTLQAKPTTCLSVTEQQKIKITRERTNWQRFISVFTGFRSFPEDKKEDELVDLPKSSNSVPLGLNLIGNNSDANFIDMEAGIRVLPFETSNHSSTESSKHLTLSAASSFSDSERDSSVGNSSTLYQTDRQRPTSLNLNSRAQSFPDEIIHPRQYLHRFQKVFDAPGLIKNRPLLNRHINQRYGKLNNCCASAAAPLSKWKRDFKSYSFEAGYFSPSGEYKFKRRPTYMDSPHAATPDRLEGNCSGSESSVCPRSFRSLSPLLEINCADSNKGACTERTTNWESLQSSSVYMTPNQDNSTGQSFGSEVKSCEEMLNLDALTLDQEVLDYTSSNMQCREFLPLNPNSSSDASDDEHIVNSDTFKYPNFPTIESDILKSDYSDARLQPNTIFGSNDKLPHSCFLIPNHKVVSRSTDSIYYDTLSALGSPSPSDPKDIDFAKIPLTEHTWRNTDTGLINCIDLATPVMPSSHDAILSPNVSDTQTSATTEPPIFSSCNVPSSQQSRSLSNESLTSLDRQCNNISYVLSTESHTTQGTDSAQETTVDSLPKSPEPNIDFNSVQSAQLSLNERQRKSPIFPCSFDRSQFESLLVPVRKSSTTEHHNTSSESTPISSRSSTPTRRHSNPSPSPERSQYQRSGCYTPDELYMANVTRLPRLSQRLGHSGTMPSLCHIKYIHE